MLEDRDLTVRLRNGDELAFKKIFTSYVKKIYQFTYGYLKNKFDAEDVTQVVFQKLWENKSKIDVEKSLNGFLFKIAFNATIDHIRKNTKHSQHLDINEKDFSLWNNDSYSSVKVESLYQASINALPAKRKEIYLLSRHEGLSNKEVANKLGISVKTVENQLTAALQAMHSFFNTFQK